MDTKLPINLNTIFETMGITDVKTQYLLTLNELEKTQRELESVQFKLERCSAALRLSRTNSNCIGNLTDRLEQYFVELKSEECNDTFRFIRCHSKSIRDHISRLENHGIKISR